MRKLLLVFIFMHLLSCSSRLTVSSDQGEQENETSMKQTNNFAHGSTGGVGGVSGGKAPGGEGGENGGSGSSHPEGGRALPLYAAGAANNQRQHSHHNACNGPYRSMVKSTLSILCTMSFIFIIT